MLREKFQNLLEIAPSSEAQETAFRARELPQWQIDNESRSLILTGCIYQIVGEAGQIYRQNTNSDHGIDGEIEFKDAQNRATGQRLYLQLKSGDSYLCRRKDGTDVFHIKKARWADYWIQQKYPVMLVIRTSDGIIRWMDISDYLKRESAGGKKVKQIAFTGEKLTALNLRRMRERFLSLPKSE